MSETGKAIAILGAKGGVGTTTIAANVAAELAAATSDAVLLVDLNLFLGDVGLHVGLEGEPTVMQWMANPTEHPTKDSIQKHTCGFWVLGLAADLKDADAVEAQDVLFLLNQLRSLFDWVLMDCGTDLNEVSLTACAYADDRLLITTEQRPSLIGAKRRLDVLNSLEIPGKTAFGVMPDWNPAEIIGIKPKPLALSLYQELVTDHIWSQQRKDYGYKNVGSNHLMANFFGTPFIDIRVDFNSWVPASLDKKISNKLVNFYIEKFIKNKNLHDKVEFEILFTCYTPSSSKKINSILKKKFSKNEIKFILVALKKINLISTRNFKTELTKIEYLKKRQQTIKDSKMYYIDKIYWLIEDCKRYGTLPFAGLARNGFVATDILNSLIKENIISQKKINDFLMEINTITSEIFKDWINLTKKNFLSRHGHLRPNTYEITSLNYNDGYNLYFSKNEKKKQIFNFKKTKVKFSSKEKIKINKFLYNSKLNLNFNQFINYIKNSIKMREYSKHVFTKSIDYLFDNIKVLCKRLNISVEDASYLKINQITDLYYNLSNHNIGETFKKEIRQNKIQYELNSYIKLPETISSIKDIYFYNESQNKINFIGNKSVYSDIIYLKDKAIKVEKLKNKIVCIESADPGYDFIFLANINGLITKYGGVNSHMSVRCSELKIPAAIGVGENKFNKIIKNKKIELNCETQKIECL